MCNGGREGRSVWGEREREEDRVTYDNAPLSDEDGKRQNKQSPERKRENTMAEVAH